MTRFLVIIPEEIDKRFRTAVFDRKGMKRGNITKAVTEAIIDWIEKEPQK